ncbi:MAG TPA: TCR/Tet family MFS transporter, partial [Myxococcota bacterium]|nr:TCR/Tet family MFS transporter [Myxococcota bacterium]
MRSAQPAVGFIFVTLFLDVLGFGLIIPILPRLIETLAGGNVSDASTIYGALAAVYSLMQFVCAPVLGSLSDKFGRRPVILLSLLGSGLDFILLALAPSIPWFFAGRVIAGITGANFATCTAYIADVSPPEKRAANFGVIGAAFGLGFIAGPALGGLLGDHGLRLPFVVAAGLTLLNWLYGLLVLPESLSLENRRAFSWSRANPVGSLTALGRHPVVAGLTWTYFLSTLAHFHLHSIWVLYTGHRYHWSIGQTGLSLAIVGITSAIVQGALGRVVIPKLGEARTVLLGLFISAVAFVGYAFSWEGWIIYIVLAFDSLGGLAGPALQSL